MKKFKPLNNREKLTIQLWLGVILVLCGIALLWTGMFLAPVGEIHPSVLTAAGEVLTFSGALIGIDYTYKYKTLRFKEAEEEERMRVTGFHQPIIIEDDENEEDDENNEE